MNSTQEEILTLFKESGALLEGHFILRSDLHSGHYFQCAKVGENLSYISRLAEFLLDKINSTDCQTVLAPAMGGLVIGQEVARQWNKRFIFAEKVNGKLALRRGFKIARHEKIFVVEDVITRGGRAQEALDIIKNKGGNPVGLAVLVDRSRGKAQFDVPLTSLLEFSFPTYQPDQLPEALKAIPATKPGS